MKWQQHRYRYWYIRHTSEAFTMKVIILTGDPNCLRNKQFDWPKTYPTNSWSNQWKWPYCFQTKAEIVQFCFLFAGKLVTSGVANWKIVSLLLYFSLTKNFKFVERPVNCVITPLKENFAAARFLLMTSHVVVPLLSVYDCFVLLLNTVLAGLSPTTLMAPTWLPVSGLVLSRN